MFLVIGGLLVISGMVLNSLLSGNAEAQEGLGNAEFVEFGFITCKGITIQDGDKKRGYFGLSGDRDALLQIYDDGKTTVAYLGRNANTGEMMFHLDSKSKTDKRRAFIGIEKRGGGLNCFNSIGESVAEVGVAVDEGGIMLTTDKFRKEVNVLRVETQ